MSTVIRPYTAPSQRSDQDSGTVTSGNEPVKHDNLNTIVQTFSVTYNKEMNTITTGDTKPKYDYNTDLTNLKEWVKEFVSENRKLISDDPFIKDNPIHLRMKKGGTSIGPTAYSELKKTIELQRDTSSTNNGDSSSTNNGDSSQDPLKLLENYVFYILYGKIGKHKGNGDLDYNISINTMSEPFDKCLDVLNPLCTFEIDNSYNILNDNPSILINKLLEQNQKIKEIKENDAFQLCIKMNNYETDNINSTLISMSIL